MRQLNHSRRTARGLTLIELMVALTIGAFLAMAAGPFFGDYVSNARLREAGNTVYGEAMFAQSEAIKRNGVVRLSINGTSMRVYERTGGIDGPTIRDSTLSGSVIASPAVVLDFGSDGRPAPFGTSVATNFVNPGMTCSSDTRCPGLRVDAGGAIRLCGNHLSGCD